MWCEEVDEQNGVFCMLSYMSGYLACSSVVALRCGLRGVSWRNSSLLP